MISGENSVEYTSALPMGEPLKQCFVVMPIGSGEEYDSYLNRYNHLFKPAVETFKIDDRQVYKCLRADLISRSGSITKSVLEHLYHADLVLADLTTLNPNVFYELGVRHFLRQGTILVALAGTKLPFDVEDLRVVFYRDRVGAELEVIPQIHEFLREMVGSASSDSPVFYALPDLRRERAVDASETKARLAAVEAELTDARTKLTLTEQSNLTLRESVSAFERTVSQILERSSPLAQDEAKREVATAIRRERPQRRFVPVASPDQDPKAVFVLMPFNTEWSRHVYKTITSELARNGYRTLRADEMESPGQIIDEIFLALQRAGAVVADVTGRNANVLYEVGLAHAMGKPTVLITQDISHVPFDVASYRVIVYQATPPGLKILGEKIRQAIA